MNQLNPQFIGEVVLALVVLAGLVVGVWRIDAHFVTRREFNAFARSTNARLSNITRHFGIPDVPIDHENGEG